MGNSTEVKSFKHATPYARIVVILMAAMVLIFSIAAITDANQIRLLRALNDDEMALAITMQEVELHDFLYSTFGYLQLGWFPALVLFLIWFYKVYRNLPALGGTGLEFSSRSVVFYFFVPILLLWKPYRATEEIWKASDPSAAISDPAGRDAIGTSSFVALWWIIWIVSNMASWFALRQSFDVAETTEAFIRMDLIYLVAEVISAISAGLTMLLVREVDRRQAAKIRVVNSLGIGAAGGSLAVNRSNSDDGDQGFQGLKP